MVAERERKRMEKKSHSEKKCRRRTPSMKEKQLEGERRGEAGGREGEMRCQRSNEQQGRK